MASGHLLDHDLLTPPEVLDYLRITNRTLYRLIKAGTVPAVRVGHQWRVRRTDLEEWLRRPAAGAGIPEPAYGTHGWEGANTAERASRTEREQTEENER